MKNCLIAFEGIDGSGKTTLSKLLCEKLNVEGTPTIWYEEREEKDRGFNALKPFVSKETPKEASLLFYLASAIHKSACIRTILETHWVICDRYVYSTLAYHAAHGVDLDIIVPLERLPIRKPDFYFFLQVEEEVRLKRLRARPVSTPDDFQKKIPGSFLDVMEQHLKKHDSIVINTSLLTSKEVLDQILAHIRSQNISPK